MSSRKRQLKSDKSLTSKRCKWGSESHQRVTHKDCPENPKRMNTTGETIMTKITDNLTRNQEEEHAKKKIIRNNGRK
jgi:hypothetical protein